MQFDAGARRAQVDRGPKIEAARSSGPDASAPFFLGAPEILSCFLRHYLLDPLNEFMHVSRRWHCGRDFFPCPLAGRGEVEVLPADSITVHERNPAASEKS